MKTEFIYRHRYSQQPLITNSSGISFRRGHEVILQIDRELGINRVIRLVSVICCSRVSIDILSKTLGGHLKTGHTWPLQNRPTELDQDKSIYNPPMAVSANIFSQSGLRRAYILA